MKPGTTVSRGSEGGASFQLALVGWCLTLCGGGTLAAGEEMRRFAFSAPGMGTAFNIILYAVPERYPEAEAAALAAFERVTALNAVFSDYEPFSEINRAAAAAPAPWDASPDLLRLSHRALELAEATEGAFDPTLGQLTRLWRSTRQRQKRPPTARLQQALASTGWQHLEVDLETRRVTLRSPGLLLDFGGIAKGFAADEMLALLKESGFPIAVVQAGGDTAAGAPPPGKSGWLVTLRTGLDDNAPVNLYLAHRSVSTSGDLHQFIEIEGVRYSHILDPRTGLGLTRRIACSVVAADTTTSDALATALCVLGPETGREVARRLGISARWVWIDENGARHLNWVHPKTEN